MIVNKYQKGGGSGSGSTVSWQQVVTGGTQIAKITINGTSQNVYAPPITALSQAEYDALVSGGTVDANTLYVII